MTHDPVEVARLFDVAAGESEALRVLDRAHALLHEIEDAKQRLTEVPPRDIRAALEYRHRVRTGTR